MQPIVRRVLVWAAVALGLSMTFQIGMYLYGMRSEAFRYSNDWLRHSSVAQTRVGSVNDVRLSFWGGYAEEASSNFHRVRFTAVIEGTKGKSEVELSLRKEGDDWVIVGCRFK